MPQRKLIFFFFLRRSLKFLSPTIARARFLFPRALKIISRVFRRMCRGTCGISEYTQRKHFHGVHRGAQEHGEDALSNLLRMFFPREPGIRNGTRRDATRDSRDKIISRSLRFVRTPFCVFEARKLRF